MIEAVGFKNVKSITAEFADTNLEAFTRSLDDGLTEFEAVRSTPFGKALRDLGLDNGLKKVNPNAYPYPEIMYNFGG